MMMYPGFSPYGGASSYGGYGLFGGGYPQMGGMYGGGYPQMGGMYGGGYPQMGAGLFGGYNPYMGFGGSQFGGGFLDHFQGQLDDMFSKYFQQQQMPGDTPATGSPSTQPADAPAEPETTVKRAGPTNVGPSTKPYADITGKYYGKTGELSKGAEQKAIDAYGSLDAFWESNQGQQMQSQRNRNQNRGDVNKSDL